MDGPQPSRGDATTAGRIRDAIEMVDTIKQQRVKGTRTFGLRRTETEKPS
jgi:hypothetical protein